MSHLGNETVYFSLRISTLELPIPVAPHSYQDMPQDQFNSMSSSFQTYKTSSLINPNSDCHYGFQKVDDEHFQFYDLHKSSEPSSKATRSASVNPENGSVKWMSSKMRLMRRLRNSGEDTNTKKMRSNLETKQQQGDYNSCSSNNNNSSNDAIRVCSDCNTTKTPLWRGGPQGPKSLCNACGIRQRKARKAMAGAAEEAMNEVLIPKENLNTKVTITSADKEKGSDGDHKNTNAVPFKKRCKFFSSEAEEKLGSDDDIGIGFSRSSDVKEAARLLMALSSDGICG